MIDHRHPKFRLIVVLALLWGVTGWVLAAPTLNRVLFRFFPVNPPYISQDHLVALIKLNPGDEITPLAIQDAVKNLYALGIFSQVEAFTRSSGTGVDLVFHVYPLPLLRDIRWRGVHRLKTSDLNQSINLAGGTILTTALIDSSRAKIEQAYRDNGYLDVKVTTDTRYQGNAANLIITVKEGPRYRFRGAELDISGSATEPRAMAIVRRLRNRFFSQEALERTQDDLRNYYLQKQYPAAVVESFLAPGEDIPNSISPAFTVDTGPQVIIHLSGVDIPVEDVEKKLAIYRLSDVSEYAEELSREDLASFLKQKGYLVRSVKSSRKTKSGEILEITFQVDLGPHIGHYELDLSGNESFSRRVVLQESGLADIDDALSRMSPGELAGAIRQFYRSQGYLDVGVSADSRFSDDVLTVSVHVDEGVVYRLGGVDLQLTDKSLQTDVERSLRHFKGQSYADTLEQDVRLEVNEQLSEKGYIIRGMQVDKKREGQNVILQITPRLEGPEYLEKVVVIGKFATRKKILSDLIKVKPDSPLNMNLVYRSESGLYGSGLFDNVTIDTPPMYGEKDHKNLVLKLREAPRFTFGYGFGYNEYEGVRGFVDWTDSNFLGLGQNLGILFRASIKKIRFQTSVLDQYNIWPGHPVNFSVFLEKQKRISFTSQRASLSAQTIHPLGKHAQLLYQISFEKVKNYDIQEGYDPTTTPQSEAPITLLSLSSTYLRDTRDDLFNPQSGGLTTVDLSFAPKVFGADTGFLTFFFQEQRYFPLRHSLVLATSFRLGVIKTVIGSETVPISERFFAGGSGSLRGFRTDRAGPLDPETHSPLGGKALLIGNVELRFPIYWILHGALFYDTGNVFKDFSSIDWKTISHTVGFGLRFKTGLGPIRLDFGYSLKDIPYDRDYQYFITIGNAF